jgi:Dehydrogenases (flavoproteins)
MNKRSSKYLRKFHLVSQEPRQTSFDIVIVGGTPAGICAAVAAARLGRRVLLLERTAHIGGLPANGLGATDIATRAATGGLFREFTRRVRQHYVDTYGPESQQVKDCSDGYHFEPSVAERVFEAMLAEQPGVTVRKNRQFDADARNVIMNDTRLAHVIVVDRETNAREEYQAQVFIDATYEGDLAAAAGGVFETRREGAAEYGEPFAGRVYRRWGLGPLGEGSTLEGDDTLQAYNYRLCLTDAPENRVPVEKPRSYDRAEYASLVEDARSGHFVSFMPPGFSGKKGPDVGVVNPVRVPNRKTDTNNHHRSFLSTDLPEENYPYPTEGWEWRDRFAQRLRDYTLGLLWFCQNDPEMPEAVREEARRWGLARDEYADNDHFPRQIYVREGRRISGEYLFTALDAISPADLPHAYAIMEGKQPAKRDPRPPIHADAVTASHYPIDSHAHRKREPGRIHLDGFLGLAAITSPYQVPYGVIVPVGVDGLLTPVPCSATHLGFGTLRMEPCWMALGHAAGVAAHLAIERRVSVRKVPVREMQAELLKQGQVLIYLRDVPREHPQWATLQQAGCLGFFPSFDARPGEPVDAETAQEWSRRAGRTDTLPARAGETRADYATRLLAA